MRKKLLNCLMIIVLLAIIFPADLFSQQPTSRLFYNKIYRITEIPPADGVCKTYFKEDNKPYYYCSGGSESLFVPPATAPVVTANGITAATAVQMNGGTLNNTNVSFTQTDDMTIKLPAASTWASGHIVVMGYFGKISAKRFWFVM